MLNLCLGHESGEWSGAIVQALIRKCSMVTSPFHHRKKCINIREQATLALWEMPLGEFVIQHCRKFPSMC